MNHPLSQKNTERFSHTAEYYAKYRPSYPAALIDFLLEREIFNQQSHIADIGAGTGIFSQLLLAAGARVTAIEPNQSMRECAENQLRQYANFTSVNATSEQTTLADASVDAITVATAFHWFDQQACQREFKRILKPDGWVMLLWNLRLPELSPITQGYDAILKKHCPQYQGIPSQQISEQVLLGFFKPDTVEVHTFDYQQRFDLDGLLGRLGSTSYALTPDQDGYALMLADMTELFQQHASHHEIIFPYLTKLYLGQL